MGKARAEVKVPVRRQLRAGTGDGTGLVAPKILKMGPKGPTPGLTGWLASASHKDYCSH